MKRFFPIVAALLLCNAGAFAQYTNELDGGIELTVTNAWSTDEISVGASSPSNALYVVDGGAVTSTNMYVGITSNATDNTVLVTGTGTLDIEDTLEVGTGTNNTVSVSDGGTIRAGNLIIHSNNVFNLNDGGTLSITGAYDADVQTNVNWAAGGTLSVGGDLTKSNGLDGVDRTLSIDGGSWTLSTDLYISGVSNTLNIVNGGGVTNNNAFVGTASSDSNNTVWVTGTNSSWYINGTLQIGATNNTGNSVTVADGGMIEAATLDVQGSNSFNLNEDGTLAVTGDFNAATNGFNWNEGGTLSVGGELTGMATTNLVVGGNTNAYAYLDGGRNLTLDGGTWDIKGTNLVVGYGGSGSSLTVTNDGWVYVGEATTNDIEVSTVGGILVASTNEAVMLVDNGSTVETTGGLYIGGTNASLIGSVSVTNGSTIEAQSLIIGNVNSVLNLDNGGTLAVTGSFNAATNGFNWNSGGTLSVGGELTGMAITNNAYYLDEGRNLTLDGGTWDIKGTNLVVGYGGSDSDLVVKNTGTLFSATTYIGWDTNSANNTIAIQDGSVWTNSSDLWVGYGADENLLYISNAGTNTMSGTAYIGNTNTASNQVLVDGTNSLWKIGGNLEIGFGSNSVANSLIVANGAAVSIDGNLDIISGNYLSLASAGSIEVGGNMHVSNAYLYGSGTIQFGTNASMLIFTGVDTGTDISRDLVFDGGTGGVNTVSMNAGTFTVAGMSSLQYRNFDKLVLNGSTLGGYGTNDGFTAIDMTGGMIDPGGSDTAATLTIDGEFSATGGTVYSAQVSDTVWDQLIFNGTNGVDLSQMNAEVFVVTAPDGPVTILSATNLNKTTFASTNMVDRLLLYKAVLKYSDTEVLVALEEDQLGASMEFASTEMIRAGFNGMKNSVFARTKQLRRNLVSTAHAIPNEVYLLTNTNAPAGAMGPGDQNTIFDMHVWMQQYSGRGDFDGQGPSDGFSLNNHGTTIGADRLIGDSLILGFNYTYARSSARTTGMDNLDTESYWLGAYGEWVGKEGLYVDAMAAYGFSNYDAQRNELNYEGSASYRGQAVGAYADVGQYYYHGDLALSPYAGIHVLSVLADGHSEADKYGSSVYVDEVSRDMVESAIGLKMRHRFDTRIGRFQTTGYAEWAHDFMQDDVSATLTAQGYPPINTGIISPDADTFNAGLGYSWISTDYLEVGIGYNGRFSENYEEHTGALMLDIRF